MATNEQPMTDVLLQAIRKFDTVERGVPSVVVSDITALLAEVDRLRAREQALQLQLDAMSSLLLDVQRDCVAARQEANAMRPIVEAVAEASVGRSTIPWIRPDGRPTRLLADWAYVPVEFREQARAFVAAHPTAGETESEGE